MKFKFNIPNKITILRVSLTPLFAIILLVNIPYKNELAAFIFIMLSVSDVLDGYFARKTRQVTEFGKLIDPIADKLLISTALIFLIGKGVVLWMAIVIIAREIILTAVRIYLLPARLVVPASNIGKAKTIVQSIAIVFVLLKLPMSWFIMLAAVLLTVISGVGYFIRIKRLTGNKIVNLPNIITLSRFLLIIPFIYYYLISQRRIALFFFAIITLSDKLDGISARLTNQKTELGSGLDSFTDYTLIISSFLMFVIKDYINILWFMLLLIPSLINGFIKLVYAKRQKIVPVTTVAKLTVGLTYVTIITILIKFANNEYIFHLLTATTIMVYLTMIGYINKSLSIPKSINVGKRRTVKRSI